MAKWRDLHSADVENYLNEVAAGRAGVDPASQTLARSSSNPQAQRVGLQQVAQRMRQNEQQRQHDQQAADAAAKEAQRQQEASAREAERQRAASEAMRVRAGAAAGMETETDIQTGRRKISTHADGAPKFKTGPVGDPVLVDTSDEDASQPAANLLMGGGNDGAIGATGSAQERTWVQGHRNDRGGIVPLPVETKTDKKTGDTYIETPGEYGQPTKQFAGVDQELREKIKRQEAIEREGQLISLRSNHLKQRRHQFDPQWKPVKEEYEAAQKELEAIGNPYQRSGESWVKINPDTGKQTLVAPEEIEIYRRKRREAEERFARARKAYEPLAPQADGLAKAENELKTKQLEWAERKMRTEYGLPDDDGGTAAELVKVETGPSASDAAVLDYVTPAPEQPAGQENLPEDASGAPVENERPLVPADRVETFTRAFSTFQNPESLTVGETTAGGTTFIRRDGLNLGTVHQDKETGAPFVVLAAAGERDVNLNSQIAFEGAAKGGVPLYLRDSGERLNPAAEAAWVAQVFQVIETGRTANPLIPDAGGADGAGISGNFAVEQRLRDMGATPDEIARKVKTGVLSVNRGEALMRDLYGDTLKAEDPMERATFDRWLNEHAPKELRDQWIRASSRKDTEQQNAVRTAYLNDWFVANRHKPGVTFKARQQAQGELTQELRTGEKIAGVGGAGAEVAGSMLGMLSAPFKAAFLQAGTMLGGGDSTRSARDEMIEQFGRASKNTWRGWEANRKKWFTEAGKERVDALDRAQRDLRAFVSTQDRYAGGVADPKFRERYKAHIDAVTDAAWEMHRTGGLEKGWEMTREDLDPSTNPALAKLINGYALTGDRTLWDAYLSALTEDHGTRQAQSYVADLTAGRGRFMGGVLAGQAAPPEEIGVEMLTTALTAGVGKAVFGGAKAASVAAKGAKTAGAGTRLARLRVAAHGIKDDFLKAGMVPDTLANPASRLGKARNVVVQSSKVAAGNALTEAPEEAIMGAADRNATAGSIASDAGVGALAGFFLGPIIGGIGGITGRSRSNYERRQAATKFAAEYNRIAGGTEGFVPLTPERAEAAMALVSPETHQEIQTERQEAVTELMAAVQAAKDSTDPAVLSRLSRAQERSLRAIDAETEAMALRIEAVQAVEAVEPEHKDFAMAVAKVAAGRSDLLTGAERRAAASRTTADGQPYFADVNGRDVVTDAGRAEAMQYFPEIGALIQTPESRAILEAQTQLPDEPNAQGQPGNEAGPAASVPVPPVPAGTAQAGAPASGSNPTQAQAEGAVAPNPAGLEAAEYAAWAEQTPDAPDASTAISQAVSAGQPVSVSLARAAGVEIPDGYSRQGAMLVPPVIAPNAAASAETSAESGAEAVAERIRQRVEAAIPGMRGRINLLRESAGAPTGGAVADPDGTVSLVLPDIEEQLKRLDPEAVEAALEQIVLRHEVVHVVQFEAIRRMAEETGATFEATFADIYGRIASELAPEAFAAAREIYGAEAWDAIPNDANRAAELTRMLVEARLDPTKADEFSELFRAVRIKASPTLIELMRRAVEMLTEWVTSGQLPETARAHVEQVEALYREMTAAPGDSRANSAGNERQTGSTDTDVNQTAKNEHVPSERVNETANPEHQPPRGLRIEAGADGRALILNGDDVLWQGAATEADAEFQSLQAAATSPLRVTGDAIQAAIRKFPRLKGRLKEQLEDAADEVSDALENLPPAERMEAAEKAIAARIDAIADAEAQRTGKKREEIIEGFRAVAGKRASQQAASIEAAVLGTEAPAIPEGRTEERETPGGEMRIEVTQAALDLDQLIGSSDPLFPGGALQPRNRATQASRNQREEMVNNLRDKPDQWRRYVEGPTTDSGRLVVSPLFGADGAQMRNEAGQPLFYVVSGNGRRNALNEAQARKVAGNYLSGIRGFLESDGIPTDGLSFPVPVSIYVPDSAKSAIDLAEFSNRDAQLAVSNTEQAVRDAASIENGNLLRLWEPDASGNAGAASNRDFFRGFARAVGDEGILDNRGELTEEGATRIERAMIAALLGPDQTTVLDQLFNRSGALGLRGLLNGVASEAGSLLKLAAEKPDFDLAPVLVDALRTAVEAKQAVADGQFRSVGDFFDQGSLFESTEATPERQLARALVESRSAKAVRDILSAYRTAADAVDTTTASMFGDDTTREELIGRALEARPVEQVAAEIEAEFGAKSDLAAKLRIAGPGVKKLDPGTRRDFMAAVAAEVERIRDGVFSAEEWQRLNPGALTPREALFQRFLDSHTPETIHGGFNRLLSKPVREALASSPAPALDPRLVEAFGNFTPDEYGLPPIPKTLPDGHPLLVQTREKKTATLRDDHPLVAGLNPEDDLARGLPDDHPARKGGFLPAGEVSRKQLRRAIVAFFMSMGRPIAPDVQPLAYATGGGGGAGKSTILKYLREDGRIDTDGAIPVNADDIKVLIPEWDELLAAGDGRAAAVVHEESSQIAKNLLDAILAEGRSNFIYDATLANTQKALGQFARWKEAGYEIAFIGVTVDPREAITRAILRGKNSGRWVPTKALVEAHAGFNRGVIDLMAASDLAYVYDNTPPLPHEVAVKAADSDQISIVNQEYFGSIKSREEEISTVREFRSRQDSTDQSGSLPEGDGGTGRVGQSPDGSGQEGSLRSSPPQLDLFGGIEPQITGPRAKTKRNALAAAKARPTASKGRENVAKRVAAMEGLDDLDLFAAAASMSLDKQPTRRDSAGDETSGGSSGQLGFDFGAGASGNVDAGRADRAGTAGNAGGTPQGPGASRGAAGERDRGDAASGVQPEVRPGAGGAGSAADVTDGGRGESEREGSGGSRAGSGDRSEQAGKRRSLTLSRPDEGSPERNHEIGKSDTLAEGGAVTRLRNNLAALELLRTLESEDRNPTTAEKRTLAKYVGWGGIPQVFDELAYQKIAELPQRRETVARYERAYNLREYAASEREKLEAIEKWAEKWQGHFEKIRDLLTREEWESARDSTINAHYTSPTVISAMWDAVKRLGFRGGNVLEPAGGVGHFFGLMPREITDASRLFGVELDSISGRIFTKLYPEAEIEIGGFQDTTLPDNSQDLVISNVPFANVNIGDPVLDAQGAPKFNLHNYFFERALRVARPGGLVAFITTAHTMDSNILQRKWLAARAEFAGAIRLPNDAFKGNANTQVVTDIIFLRKPDGSPAPWAGSWTSTEPVKASDGAALEVNEWFAQHPEMILGRLAGDGSMYGANKVEMTVHSTGPIKDALDAAISRLPENILSEGAGADVLRNRIANRKSKQGAFVADENGNISIHGQEDSRVSAADAPRVRSFMRLRDALNDLYEKESSPGSSDAAVAAARRELNAAYDHHARQYGPLHDRKNKEALQNDPDYYRTLGLEVPVKGKKTFSKADVFSRRVLTPREEPRRADSVEEGIVASLRWKGRLDAAYIGELLNVSLEEAEAQILATAGAFRNPENGRLETREAYLSGNIRKKLRTARLAAEKDATFRENVEALEKVLPENVPFADIDVKMGSTWVPPEIYARFVNERIGLPHAEVHHHPGIGEMVSDSYQVVDGTGSNRAEVTWGTGRRKAAEIVEAALNMRDPVVRDSVSAGDGKTKSVANPEETQKARQAVERVNQAFLAWLSETPDVQDTLHTAYNETFNSHVVPQYDGSHLQLPWVAEGFDLYPDKKHVVWRALQDGNLLVAHGVGGGKTIIGTAIALELKRLGMANKPLIVVHNATLEQFATEIAKMAPTARVLVARKDDLAGPKRKEFMGRVAAGDWDAVVMAHSTFDMMPDDPAWEKKVLGDLVSELIQAIRDAGEEPGTELRKIKDPSVKEMVKQLNRLRERMAKLQDRRTDDVLTFQEIGFDALIMDEAHKYKKTPFVTKQSTIAGIDTGFSKKGAALLLRTKFIQAKNSGRGVFMMTGTPVTNTLGESWNMVRTVRPDLLEDFNVKTFDRFVGTFAKIKTSGELRANGSYKSVSRLSELSNLPEWNRFWGLAADVKMGDDMQVKGRPKIKGGKPELVSVERTPGVEKFVEYIQKVIADYDAMEPKEKRENSHIPLLTYNAARMAAIDMRLVNPAHADEPGSKANEAIKRVLKLYKDTTPHKGTQVIFSDSYRPLRTTKLDMSAAEFETANEAGDAEAEPEGGFNLYEDIREKLVKAGVPRSEIGIITEAKNDKARAAMAEAVNQGKIRIIMGSTEKLGTGVNMQKRMIAAHHLDVPWTPAGLEQRDGRVYRQGNQWEKLGREVELLRYGMKDTLDAALWQKLETKERFIKQAISGKNSARTVEDDTGLINLAEQKAILSGPDGMLKFDLDEKVRNLSNDFRAWRNRQYDLQRAIRDAERSLKSYEETRSELDKVAKEVAPLRVESLEEAPIRVAGGETLKGSKGKQALAEAMKERSKAAGKSLSPNNTPSLIQPIPLEFNGVSLQLVPVEFVESVAGAANPDTRWNANWKVRLPGTMRFDAYFHPQRHPGSVLSEIQRVAEELTAQPERERRYAERDRETIQTAKVELDRPFDQRADLESALIDQARLYARMRIEQPLADSDYQTVLGDSWKERLAAEKPDPEAGGSGPQAATPLLSSPAPEVSEAAQQALAKMPPIYRRVFEAVNGGTTPEQVMQRYNLTERAVRNILNQVRARLDAATTAASEAGLNPVMQGNKIKGGRPDLALSTNRTVAAIDQIRNESGIPDKRGFEEVHAEARAMLENDYEGTYDALLEKARNVQPMTDTEVSAAKMIIARETMEGRTQTAAERTKIALMIHGYRDVGTETARSLAIRRDPHQTPAQRHAQFIAEALFTPDPATRARLRNAPRGGQEAILAAWMAKVDGIKAELAARGLDLDASLAEFHERQEAIRETEAESPRVKQAVDETIRKLNKREKAVIEAIRSGALVSKAAFVTGLSVDDVRAIYSRFLGDIRAAMAESAQRFLAGALASSPVDMMGAILTDLGLPPLEAIDDTRPDFVDRRNEKPRKPRKKKAAAPKKKAPTIPGITPEQQQALDEAWERFQKAPLTHWETFWQEEMKTLQPMFGRDGFEQWKAKAIAPWREVWQTEMKGLDPAARMGFDEWIAQPLNREKVGKQQNLFPAAPPNEIYGVFDLNDPVAMKEVGNAFAIARSTRGEKIMEFWRMSILSGPQTHVVNVGSNVMHAAYRLLPRRAAEATANTVLSAIGLGSQESATFGEFAVMTKHLRNAAGLAARQALASWQTERRIFEKYAKAAAEQSHFTGLGAEEFEPALGGKLGKAMRSISFRPLTMADEFIKFFTGQLEAAAQAHRIAKVEEKLTGSAYEARMKELLEPGSVAWVRAMDEARTITFQSKIDGTRPQLLNRLDQIAEMAKRGRTMPWLGKPMTFFIPFIDTPLNIFKEAVKMSPLGLFLAVVDGTRALKRKIARGDLSKAEADAEAAKLYNRVRLVEDITNQTIALMAYYAIAGMVEGDDDELPFLTGSMEYKSSKKGERDNAFAVMPPQSIRIGDTIVSYRRYEPFATVLASMADLAREIDRHGGLKPGVASQWIASHKDQLTEKTFLQGLSMLNDAFQNPERFGARLTGNIVTGFVPNIIRQPIRNLDPKLRDTRPRADEGFFESVARSVGYSLVPQAAPVRQDVWGNDIEKNRGELIGGVRPVDAVVRIFDPSNTTVNPEVDPLDAWIFRWNLATADSSERIAIEPIPSDIRRKVPGEKKARRVALTDDEQTDANRAAGRMARQILGDGWENRPLDEEHRNRIVQTVRQAQRIARDQVWAKKVAEGLPEE